jgi:phosphoenolpyruvate phosphomutase
MPFAQSLRSVLARKDLLHVMATHSPLSARLAEEAGFDGLWASGFELSALYGLADVSLISMTQHLDMLRCIAARTNLPIIADIDTGFGNAVNVVYAVREYERAGAAAVVIEDKTFPKVTSLVADGRQELLRTEEFQGKLEAAVATREHPEFMIIGRTEALIAGLGEEEALRRAYAYEEAGADMIVVHSKSKTPEEIESFVCAWNGKAPVVIIPTAYPDLRAARIRELGKIRAVIYGNHAVRASVAAMQAVFAQIVHDQDAAIAARSVVPVEEIFRLQNMAKVKEQERRFLR